MDIGLVILQILLIFVMLPAIIAYAIVGFLVLWNRFRTERADFLALTCTVDADCPDGYVCQNGVCVVAR